VTMRDITSAARTTGELAEHRQRLLQTLEAADMGIWDWDLETDLVERPSRTYEIVRGLPAGSTRDHPQANITMAQLLSSITPDCRPAMEEAVRRTIERGEVTELELTTQATPGGVVWLQVWMSAYRDTTGRVRGLRGLLKDITARKQASEELRHLKDRYHSIVELSPHPTWIVEAGLITLVNRAAINLLASTRRRPSSGARPRSS